MAARVAVERRDAHQAVNARFGLQPAIRSVSFDQKGRRLDAGFFAVVNFEQFDLVALAFRPARVHAQEDIGPVLALCAAGAGMDFEIGVVAVGLAGQHRFYLAAGGLGAQDPQGVLGFLDNIAVALFLTQFDEIDRILHLLLESAHAGDAVIEMLAFPHQFLRFGPHRSRGLDPRICCSTSPAVLPPDPSQRCLLSRLMACLISSTIFSISVRMILLLALFMECAP